MKIFLTLLARLIKTFIVLISFVIVLNPFYEHYHFLATTVELFFLGVALIVQYIFYGSLDPLYLFRSHKSYEIS